MRLKVACFLAGGVARGDSEERRRGDVFRRYEVLFNQASLPAFEAAKASTCAPISAERSVERCTIESSN